MSSTTEMLENIYEKRKSNAKGALSAVNMYRRHLRQNRQATKVLTSIENARGKTDPALLQRCDEYASDILGWKGYAPWLYVYTATAGTFKEGWIPDNFYGAFVVPATSGRYGDVSHLKPLSRSVFSSEMFPDVASYVNGFFYDKDLQVVRDEHLESILFNDRTKVVYKTDESLQGLGVHVFDRSSFNIEKIRSLPSGVFQEYLHQHPLLAELMPSSVATLRVTTVIDDSGLCSARAAYVRIGRSADTHVQSKSHIRVGVDLESGNFCSEGYPPDWVPIDRHPDTKIFFAGRRVPEFDKCLSSVINLHYRMPFVRSIGWDVTVDRHNQVKIMEWNGTHNGIEFSEAIQGPCFRDLHWEELRHV